MSEPPGQITAAILVGGQGTRLRTVVPDQQKVIAAVAGKPFLFRLLDELAKAGLTRVVLCTGYKADQVATVVGENYRGMTVRYSAEAQPLGTAGALRHALPLLETDPVLVLNGDSFCEVDLPALLRRPANTLVVTEVADTRERGRIDFNPTGTITSFAEKAQAGRGWINAGVYLLSRALLESIPADQPVSIERETFPAWVGRGLYAFPTHGRFLDIGTAESYSAAQEFFP